MLFNSKQRAQPHQFLKITQVLHGCRQFVAPAVWFIPGNERNPYKNAKSAWDHFKSSWPQWTGLQVCYISGPNQAPPSPPDNGKARCGRIALWNSSA